MLMLVYFFIVLKFGKDRAFMLLWKTLLNEINSITSPAVVS